jgi:hypothetical protein
LNVALCPVCGAQVQDDFGLIECPSCSAQLIVHMDGRVEYSGAKEPTAYDTDEKTEVTKEKPEDAFEFGEAAGELEIPEEVPAPEVDEAGPDKDLMQEAEFSAQEARYEENDPTMLQHEPEHHEPEVPPPSDAFDIVPEEPRAEVYRPSDAQNSPDLSDIAKFGNSGASSGRDGSLRYNLFISGIDTADVREAFREAITDRKLVWDIDQILRSLKNGEVLIPNVTAPKAYILISRLRNVPVQVKWEQYALSQT